MLEKLAPIEDSSDSDNEVGPKIGYQLSILSLVQLQLPKTRREPAARYAELQSSMSWDDLKDQLKIRVADVLFPAQGDVSDEAFELLASVARYIPAPVPLASAVDYDMVKKHALKMKVPVVKVFVKQKLAAIGVRHTVLYSNSLYLGIVMGFQTRGRLRVRVRGVRVYRSQPRQNPYPWHGFVRV
jgi:hypothetical protein